METSNTGENRPANKGQFKKGDKRINRKGRPKSFDALRELARQIGHEIVEVRGLDGIVHRYTVTEAIMRQWASNSKNPKLQEVFIQIAYGKVPDAINLNVDKPIKIIVTVKDQDA